MDRNIRLEKLTRLAGTAIFMGLVAAIQLFLGVITIWQVNLNFVLIPIIISGIIFGKTAGALTGTTFGLCVFIQCITGQQGVFGTTLVEQSPTFTFFATVLRGFLVGFLTTLVYEKLSARSKSHGSHIAVLSVTGAVAATINTSLFLVMLFALFNGFVQSAAEGSQESVMYWLFITLAGMNFIIEMVTALILTPPIAMALTKAKQAINHNKS